MFFLSWQDEWEQIQARCRVEGQSISQRSLLQLRRFTRCDWISINISLSAIGCEREAGAGICVEVKSSLDSTPGPPASVTCHLSSG